MINIPDARPISHGAAFAIINSNVESLQDAQRPKLTNYVARRFSDFAFSHVDWEAERRKFNEAKALPDREDV